MLGLEIVVIAQCEVDNIELGAPGLGFEPRSPEGHQIFSKSPIWRIDLILPPRLAINTIRIRL